MGKCLKNWPIGVVKPECLLNMRKFSEKFVRIMRKGGQKTHILCFDFFAVW
jgi:hypothetical protein